jgi:maleate cis-trans isomerase
MEYKERVDQIVESSNTRTERMFPILNKIDRIWNHNSDLQFCELVKLIVSDSYTDLEFTKKLDEYIDNNGIK